MAPVWELPEDAHDKYMHINIQVMLRNQKAPPFALVHAESAKKFRCRTNRNQVFAKSAWPGDLSCITYSIWQSTSNGSTDVNFKSYRLPTHCLKVVVFCFRQNDAECIVEQQT